MWLHKRSDFNYGNRAARGNSKYFGFFLSNLPSFWQTCETYRKLFLGEHGWFNKRFIYEESLKTPFVIRYPGVIKPHTQINQLVSNIDWAPTVLSLTGTAIPKEIQGESFLPLLKGEKTSWRKEAYYHYYEFPQPHHVYPYFGLHTDQYKLVRFYGPGDFWELYDLKKDPTEIHNLYVQKGNEALTADLKAKLRLQIEKYKDNEALQLFDSNL